MPSEPSFVITWINRKLTDPKGIFFDISNKNKWKMNFFSAINWGKRENDFSSKSENICDPDFGFFQKDSKKNPLGLDYLQGKKKAVFHFAEICVIFLVEIIPFF